MVTLDNEDNHAQPPKKRKNGTNVPVESDMNAKMSASSMNPQKHQKVMYFHVHLRILRTLVEIKSQIQMIWVMCR